MTLSELIEEFIGVVCAGKQNETPAAYRGKLKRLLTYWGDRPIDGMTAADVERFLIDLQTRSEHRRGSVVVDGGLSPWTIKTVMTTVKYFLRWCAEHGHIPNNPAQTITTPRPGKPDPKAVDAVTIERMIETAANYGPPWERTRNVAILYTLRDTGGRIGGLVNAEVQNLDLYNGYLVTREKGDQLRILFLNAPTVGALTKWLPCRQTLEPVDHHLFITATGTGLTRKGFYSSIRTIAKAANVEGRYNPHAWRHAFARDSLRAGADLSQVSQMMGHSSIVVTADYYARWADHELKQTHRRVSPGRILPLPNT